MFTGHESLRLLPLGATSKIVLYHTNPYPVQKLQAEIEVVAEEITSDMLRDAFDNFVFCLQSVF
jgi:hypothetical protein